MVDHLDYDFVKLEKKWQDAWEKNKIFVVNDNLKDKKKFYVLDMFPYPSAAGLHMGHAFVFTIGDIFARFKRLQGFNVLYPIGYDSLGLPAENAAIKVGEHPDDYTKKSIVNFMVQQKAMGWSYDWSRVLKTSDPEFYRWDQWIFLQMLKEGVAYRKKASVNYCVKCDTVLANEQVVDGKCWRHEDTSVTIKPLEQWFLNTTKYADELLDGLDDLDWPENAKILQRNWIGKSHGSEITFLINDNPWKIFTTRPDTLFGVTFIVVSAQHPELMSLVTKEQKMVVDKFLKKITSVSEKDSAVLDKEGVFTGSYAIHPLTMEKVPVWAGNFVLPDYGSGMVMAVPAHDQRDYVFAKKYDIPIKPVIIREHNESFSYVMGVDENLLKKFGAEIVERTNDGAFKIKIPFDRLEDYKKLIIDNMKPGFWNEFSTTNGFSFIFKHKNGKIEEFELSEKTNNIIDKYGMTFNNESPKSTPENVYSWLAKNDYYKDLLVHTDNGNLVNSGEFDGLNSVDAKVKITKHLEKLKLGKSVVNFKLRDWLVSRQRYWGTPIPVVYCSKCGIVPVPESQLPVVLPKVVKFGKGNPLLTNDEWINTSCPKCGSPAKRETDTMDTFANSSWYFLRYCDPHNVKKIFAKKLVDYWCPVDSYIGGPEHICMHLIYSRFYTKFLRDIGLINFSEPAKKYFTQGLILASDGDKMSKSKGNVVEPLDNIRKFGADSLRFFLMSVASLDKGFAWDDKEINGVSKFIRRIFNHYSVPVKNDSSVLLDKLNKAILDVQGFYDSFDYRKATIVLRELFGVMESDGSSSDSRAKFLQLINPLCPHITEELWEGLGMKGFIALSSWPNASKVKVSKKSVDLNDKIISNVKLIVDKFPDKKKVYLYVLPFEISKVDEKKINKALNRTVKIFSVTDNKKYDPENKSPKAKPGMPGVFLE